jgi:hypothetical protein
MRRSSRNYGSRTLLSDIIKIVERAVEAPLSTAERQLGRLFERPEYRHIDLLRILSIYALVLAFGAAYVALETGIVHIAPSLEFLHIPAVAAIGFFATAIVHLRHKQAELRKLVAEWRHSHEQDKRAISETLLRCTDWFRDDVESREAIAASLAALLDLDRKLRDRVEIMLSTVRVSDAGDANQAALAVARRMGDAIAIRNTFIGSTSEPYTPNVNRAVEESIVAFINRDNVRYEEVCSVGATTDRIRRISEAAGVNSVYRPRVLKGVPYVPMCNFVILDYGSEDDGAEVFFGWGNFNGGVNERVFRSKDESIVRFFADYFAALVNISTAYASQMTTFRESAAQLASHLRNMAVPAPGQVYEAVASDIAHVVQGFAEEEAKLSPDQIKTFATKRLEQVSGDAHAEQTTYLATHIINSRERARIWQESQEPIWFGTYITRQRRILELNGKVRRLMLFERQWWDSHRQESVDVLRGHLRKFQGTSVEFRAHVVDWRDEPFAKVEDVTILNGRELFLWEVPAGGALVSGGTYITNPEKVAARVADFNHMFENAGDAKDLVELWGKQLGTAA